MLYVHRYGILVNPMTVVSFLINDPHHWVSIQLFALLALFLYAALWIEQVVLIITVFIVLVL